MPAGQLLAKLQESLPKIGLSEQLIYLKNKAQSMIESVTRAQVRPSQKTEETGGIWLRFNFSDTSSDPEKTIKIVTRAGWELIVGPAGFQESHNEQCHGSLPSSLYGARVCTFNNVVLGSIIDLEVSEGDRKVSGLKVCKDDISCIGSEERCKEIAALWSSASPAEGTTTSGSEDVLEGLMRLEKEGKLTPPRNPEKEVEERKSWRDNARKEIERIAREQLEILDESITRRKKGLQTEQNRIETQEELEIERIRLRDLSPQVRGEIERMQKEGKFYEFRNAEELRQILDRLRKEDKGKEATFSQQSTDRVE